MANWWDNLANALSGFLTNTVDALKSALVSLPGLSSDQLTQINNEFNQIDAALSEIGAALTASFDQYMANTLGTGANPSQTSGTQLSSDALTQLSNALKQYEIGVSNQDPAAAASLKSALASIPGLSSDQLTQLNSMLGTAANYSQTPFGALASTTGGSLAQQIAQLASNAGATPTTLATEWANLATEWSSLLSAPLSSSQLTLGANNSAGNASSLASNLAAPSLAQSPTGGSA
jgi:hypothetical protein